MSTIVPHMMWP